MRVILTISLLFLLFNLQAQDFPGLKDVIVDSNSYTPTYRYKALGLSYRTTRDEALSPLRFEGVGIGFSSSSWKYRKEWLWQSHFSSRASLLVNEPASSNLSEAGFSYAFTPLKELTQHQDKHWRFWVGPEMGMLLHLRMHSRNTNNVAAYDWATTLGISAMLSHKFKLWGRSFALSNQFQLPLFFFYARPPYAWGIPPGIYEEQEGAWKEAFRFGTLNHIFSLRNQLNLDFYLKKRKKGKLLQYRAYRLTYSWNYFQINTLNKIQTGGHLLSLSRALSF